jgi:glycosyltransferase involved in cell wall biosynthesis
MENDRVIAQSVVARLNRNGFVATHIHQTSLLDLGTARNCAVEMAETEWVMHLDADDTLLPGGIRECQAVAADADVIQAGYVRSGRAYMGSAGRKERIYRGATGLEALQLPSICSGCSPFRKSLWKQRPYRTDMLGAWDTALWLGFARLNARFRPTKHAVFSYFQHADSVFNKRRKLLNWTRQRTTAQLKSIRRNDEGVAIIIPRDRLASDRSRIADRVMAHYRSHHQEWPIVVGYPRTSVWSKGEAIADALARTSADVIIIADADCIVDPIMLRASVMAVINGAAWAMPHRMVYRADKAMTEQYLLEHPDQVPTLPDRHSVARDPYEGFLGGGIVVTRRVWYEAIGGIPKAFKGWGSEDQALATACLTLLGPCIRGDADLLHLYHTPAARTKQPVSNLQILRHIGQAAKHGPDELVATLLRMTALPVQTIHRKAAPKPIPIRRRMP